MKKIVLSISLMAASFASFAQLEVGGYVQPQAAYLFDKDLFDDPQFDPLPKFAMAFGVNVGYNFTERIGIRSGIGYSAQGLKSKVQGTDQMFADFSFNYLTLPVLFKYNSSMDNGSAFYLTLGPEFNFLLAAEGKNLLTNLVVDGKDSMNSMDIATVLGLGGQFRLTDNLYMYAGVQFKYGLLETEKNRTTGEPGNNATVGLQVGCNYVLGDN